MTAPAPRAFGEGVRVYVKDDRHPDAIRIHNFLGSMDVDHEIEEWNDTVDLYLALSSIQSDGNITEEDIGRALAAVKKDDWQVLTVARRGEEDVQFLGSVDECLVHLGEMFSD